MKFKSFEDLKHYIKNMTEIALDTEVKDGVIQSFMAYADADVYSLPTSGIYKRRYSLKKEESYDVNKRSEMSIAIKPEVEFNPFLNGVNDNRGLSKNTGNELAGLINYGNGWGGYSYDWAVVGPRPFIDHVKEDLDDGMYKELLKYGLESLGIPVK